jgi:hypothetical protein
VSSRRWTKSIPLALTSTEERTVSDICEEPHYAADREVTHGRKRGRVQTTAAIGASIL